MDWKGAKPSMEENFQISTTEKIIDVYSEIIGSLLYLSTISRPDISYATSYLSRYLNKPLNQVEDGKQINDVKHTEDFTLVYKKNSSQDNIVANSDADWATDKNDRKSVSGMAIFYKAILISWSSKKQQCVALSTAEPEYIASAACVAKLKYLKGLAEDIIGNNIECTMLLDSQSALRMIESYGKYEMFKTH